jgi:hypothetical protein
LKEKIPEECFLTQTSEKEKNGFLIEVLNYFYLFLKEKPTSKKCLDYFEALLLNPEQVNYLEVYFKKFTLRFSLIIINIFCIF